MSRRLILGLIAGIGAAALPLGLLAAGGESTTTVTTTGRMSAGPGQTVVIQKQMTVTANGNVKVTVDPAAPPIAPATQPDADATTQPADDATTQPAADANPQPVGPVVHFNVISNQPGAQHIWIHVQSNAPATQPAKNSW